MLLEPLSPGPLGSINVVGAFGLLAQDQFTTLAANGQSANASEGHFRLQRLDAQAKAICCPDTHPTADVAVWVVAHNGCLPSVREGVDQTCAA